MGCLSQSHNRESYASLGDVPDDRRILEPGFWSCAAV